VDVDNTLDRVIWNLRAKAKAAGISQAYFDAFVTRERAQLRASLDLVLVLTAPEPPEAPVVKTEEALTLPAPANEPRQKYDRVTRWRPEGEPPPKPSVSTLDPNVVVRSKHRGHMLVMPEITQRLPKLYATEKVPLDDKVLQVKFFNPYGSGTWYGAEADAVLLDRRQVPLSSKDVSGARLSDKLYDVTFFGYVTGLGDDKWGYFSLRELEEMPARIMGKVQYGIPAIERDVTFKPGAFRTIVLGEKPEEDEAAGIVEKIKEGARAGGPTVVLSTEAKTKEEAILRLARGFVGETVDKFTFYGRAVELGFTPEELHDLLEKTRVEEGDEYIPEITLDVLKMRMRDAGYKDEYDLALAHNAALMGNVHEALRAILEEFQDANMKWEERGLLALVPDVDLWRVALPEGYRPVAGLLKWSTGDIEEYAESLLRTAGMLTWADEVNAMLDEGETEKPTLVSTVSEPEPESESAPELLPLDQWRKGVRVVVRATGAHGVITDVHHMTTELRAWGESVASNRRTTTYADLVLDSGRKASTSADENAESTLLREVGPAPYVTPDPVIPLAGYNHDKSEAEDPFRAWQEVVGNLASLDNARDRESRARKASKKAEWRNYEESVRSRLEKQLAAWDAWYDRYAHEAGLISNPVSKNYEFHHMLAEAEVRGDKETVRYLRSVPKDWLTRWNVGDHVLTKSGSREVIHAIEGEYARIKDGREGVPLWTLRLDTGAARAPAASAETFDKPRYITTIAKEMLVGDGYPDRAAVAKAVKMYLANHGIPVSTSVPTGSRVTWIDFTPPRDAKERWKKVGDWSREQALQIQKLLIGVSLLKRYMGEEAETVEQSFNIYPWGTEDKSDSMTDYFHPGGVMIPPEHQAEFAGLLARAMQVGGQSLNRLGEERLRAHTLPVGSIATPIGQKGGTKPAEFSTECREISFSSSHGPIRVVCGAQGRRDTWNNIFIGNLRYGWNGRRWSENKIPPSDVLVAVREHGVGAFPAS
jgi:hypothetical protein